MDALLVYADSERSAALRHEVPLPIGDPFLWVGRDGRAPLILTNVLEYERIAQALPDAELVLDGDLGFLDMVRGGTPRDEAELTVVSRAVREAGVRAALVPPEFPLAVADRLRADGVELRVDAAAFERRRRAKTAAELAGIRRAQVAAEAAMAAARDAIWAAEQVDGRLVLDGEPLTAERVRAAARGAAAAAGAPAPADIMVSSLFSAGGHDPGSGPLPADLPVVVDLWPCDEQTGCWADMTRTFVNGTLTDAVAALRDAAREALESVRAATRPGVSGRALYDIAADVVERAGHPTQRTAAPGERLRHGFYFGLGHGVGLELHEAPRLGLSGRDELVPGDVIAIEPGIEGLEGLGGVRFEDLLLVTAGGCETLTDFPYDLTP